MVDGATWLWLVMADGATWLPLVAAYGVTLLRWFVALDSSCSDSRTMLLRLIATYKAITSSCAIENLAGLSYASDFLICFCYVIKPFSNSAWKPLVIALACSGRWSHTTLACIDRWSHNRILLVVGLPICE